MVTPSLPPFWSLTSSHSPSLSLQQANMVTIRHIHSHECGNPRYLGCYTSTERHIRCVLNSYVILAVMLFSLVFWRTLIADRPKTKNCIMRLLKLSWWNLHNVFLEILSWSKQINTKGEKKKQLKITDISTLKSHLTLLFQDQCL